MSILIHEQLEAMKFWGMGVTEFMSIPYSRRKNLLYMQELIAKEENKNNPLNGLMSKRR